MKIGLLGAPESGKSAMARKIARSFSKEEKFVVIDKYVEDLEKKTGYYFGEFSAAHPQHLQIMLHRWTKEQEAECEDKSYIVCGTIYDSILYDAIHSLIAERSDPSDLEERLHIETTMRAMAMCERLTADYDLLFYIPYDSKKAKEVEKSWNFVFDQKVQQILQGYNQFYTILDKTEKENAKNARQIIKALKDAIAEDEQRSVRGSGGDDSEVAQEEESVSNMLSEGGGSGGDDILAQE